MNYKQIAEYERYIIKALLDEGKSLRSIARILTRSVSTISREIKRNSGKRGYRPKQANMRSNHRHRNRIRFRKLSKVIKRKIKTLLKHFWSPEQICGTLRMLGEEIVSTISIYRFISKDKKDGGCLWKYLRHGNKKYRKKYGSQNSQSYIVNRKSIDERPEIVDQKMRIGDWEADTVVGKNHKGFLVTLVERKTKFTLIGYCMKKSSDSVGATIVDLLYRIRNRVMTITCDNGKEFAGHEVFGDILKADVYFAHPYSSWERGLNENTNGLIRQFLPKQTSFLGLKEKTINRIQDLLNARPRKSLGYKTPNELFLEH